MTSGGISPGRPADDEAVLEQWRSRLELSGLHVDRDEFFSTLLAKQVVNLRCGDPSPPKEALADVLREFCRAASGAGTAWLLSARLPANARAYREALEDNGFHLVECYLTLQHPLQAPPASRRPGPPLRPAVEADIPMLRKTASAAFEFSRLHLDPRVPKEAADRSRADWVENAVRGRAERVLVTELEGSIAGFVTCMRRPRPEGDAAVLDLMAVAPGCRGRGIGRALVQAFLDFASEGPFAFAEVGTQAQNLPAVRIYEKAGFRTSAVRYTYHLHLPAEGVR